MWSRHELKSRAKAVLKTNYWKAFLISFVILIAKGARSNTNVRGEGAGQIREMIPGFIMNHLTFFITAGIGIALFGIALRVFLWSPLEVGGRKYFIQSAQYKDNKECFRFAFRSENYGGIVITMLRKGVQNFLWFLLFIIPGIIKTYSYSMVPYILADNPSIGSGRAIEISERMTKGHKLDMFILDLSFIGWYILGALAFFIGTFFVWPYYDATYAELYLTLRKRILELNYMPDDFNLI